jgi:HD-GYP domain-containing protein (c-di-GMP phosphodiesterase class II)
MIARELVKEGKYTEIFTEQFLDDFAIAAALHDVGKIKIPDAILNKPGKLTKEEFDVMKEHTLEGEKIIELALKGIGVSSEYLETARQVSGGHHERWDGTGYPRGLKGDEIPLCARIVAIADVFDALTCLRPYKEPWPFEKALATIQEESGTHFDPELVDAFVAIKDEVKEYLDSK